MTNDVIIHETRICLTQVSYCTTLFKEFIGRRNSQSLPSCLEVDSLLLTLLLKMSTWLN